MKLEHSCARCKEHPNRLCPVGEAELRRQLGGGPPRPQTGQRAGGKFAGINAARARARARATEGTAAKRMTRPERARAKLLAERYAAGELLPPGALFEPLKLWLGNDCTYRPDFVYAESATGLIVCEEVKGRRGWKLDDEGRTKWKVAGERYPIFEFRGLVLGEDGAWETETYKPRGPWPKEEA